jgi:glycerol-3-phosphate dehydrogenase
VLREDLRRGFVYSDCWVDDSRLVVLNASDAAERGARILTRTRFLSAQEERGQWRVACEELRTGRRFDLNARAIVNVAGPWVERVLDDVPGIEIASKIRLVKGSHIVVPRIYDGRAAFLLQHPDKRVIFALPFERAFTLIGTTDVAYEDDPSNAAITEAEITYLCESASRYFRKAVTPSDVRWTYAGVRPLLDDASADVSKITRDYRIEIAKSTGGAPLVSVLGGKITTYRRLAEAALEQLLPELGLRQSAWTANAPLPGGDIPGGNLERFVREVAQRWPFLEAATRDRLARAYGTRVERMLGASRTLSDLGEHFGSGLTEAELDYLRSHEWAERIDDVLWRRTKLGLHLSSVERERLARYMAR